MNIQKYILDAGITKDSSEGAIRRFFDTCTSQYGKNQLRGRDYISIIEALLYKIIYPNSISISDLNFINLLELIADTKDESTLPTLVHIPNFS